MGDHDKELWSDAAHTAPVRLSAIPLDDVRPPRGTRHISLVIYHRDGPTSVTLEPGRTVVIGRVEPVDVLINDPSLSRQHARFSCSETEVRVEDLGSTNGTRVNGVAVRDAPVRPEDEVILGAITAYVHVSTARADPEEEGLESHDRFVDRLEDEVLRAREFRRPLAMVMVRPLDRGTNAATLFKLIRALLRPVDRAAVYAADALEIVLPEMPRDRATELASAIITRCSEMNRPAFAGVSMFGERGTSAEALLEHARAALLRAGPAHQIHVTESNDEADDGDDVVIASQVMRELFATVRRLAKSPIPVLIQGETGTGKEVVAHQLHEGGPRGQNPMRSINCGAIPPTLIESVLFGHERGAFTGADRRMPGMFEQAHRGTVFLDEVSELPPPAQAALLRVLETKRLHRIGSTEELEVDVRIVAASNKDLEAMCKEGKFRSDLWYRLNTMCLEIPPLRERVSEIAPMADCFRKRANRANGTQVTAIDGAVIALFESYRWPGNVRELRNVIERAVVVANGATITVADVSERVRAAAESEAPDAPNVESNEDDQLDFKGKVRRYETELILHAMAKSRWNRTEAAKLLRIPLRTLTHKLGAYDLRGRAGEEEE